LVGKIKAVSLFPQYLTTAILTGAVHVASNTMTCCLALSVSMRIKKEVDDVVQTQEIVLNFGPSC
jgi:hypothetical protein